LSLEEREAVRTPMQWSDAANAGFSTASAEKLFRPVIEEREFSYKNVNVEKQMADKNSFWHWMRKLIACTHELEELNHGKIELLKADESAILIHASTWKDSTTITIHN